MVPVNVKQSAPRKRGGTQPSPLTIDDVIDAALRVAARGDIDDVTIKALADELGVTSPAIYHYVRGREEIVRRVCERVAALVPLGSRPGLGWDEQIVAIMLDMHEAFARYPGVGVLALSLGGPAPAAEQMAVRMIAILRDAGFSRRDATHAVTALYFYFSGWLLGRPPFLPGGARSQPRMTPRLLAEGTRYVLAGLAATRA
jgi:TetR/AcrR family transcriptional regulator, tetracycline repressor protein